MRTLALVLVLSTVGCKTEEPEPEPSALLERAAEIAGIYTVMEVTDNGDGCTEGPSVALSFTDLAVDGGSFFGVEFVQALGCDGVADCREALETDLTIGSDSWLFEELDGSDVTGTSVVTVGSGGTCEGTVTFSRLSSDGQTLTIREEVVRVSGFAEGADGFCDTEAAKALASGQSCDSLRVVRASFSEGI